MEVFTPPAGDVLRNWLEKRGWTQKVLSDIIGRPAQWASEVISGKKSITVESAAMLGAALGTSADYWLLVQDRHRLWVLSQNKQNNKRLDEIRARAEQENRKRDGPSD
jgi:HTH-type transcriptional regulator/antitoxin HigA